MHNQLPKTLAPLIGHFLKPYKHGVILCIFFALCAGLWGPLNSLLIKNLINLLPNLKNDDVSILIWPAGLIVMNFIVFDNFTWRSINYIWAKYVPLIQNKIISQMLDYSLSHSHNFYQNNLSGKISKQINNLVDGITRIVTYTAANFLRATSLLFAAFFIAYSANPLFFYVLFFWFVCFVSISIILSKKLVFLADALASEESKVVGELVDSLSNHNNVRIFARKLYENIRILPFFDKQRHAYTKSSLGSLFLYCIQGALIAIMMAFSTFLLIYLYGKKLITIGDFALILGLSMETAHIMWFTMSEIDEFNKAVGRCKQSLKTLMVPIEICDDQHAVTLNCTQGEIVFDAVTFHYKGSTALFKNKSLIIEAGQKVGLVGYSGGGKSTFVNLILRLYDVTGGAILIDGQNIRNVTQDSLRINIGMIPQDPSLFHRSLYENIAYGNPNASKEAIIDAAKKAHAHDFIMALEEGYDAMVGERGVKLSGGQRQRIAIARAFLKNAPILILDEATSQMDSLTETYIQESLFKLMENKTTLVIAHRLSTLLQMDRILVFEKGVIVEEGSHEALLQKQGLYKKLWDTQVGGYIRDEEG